MIIQSNRPPMPTWKLALIVFIAFMIGFIMYDMASAQPAAITVPEDFVGYVCAAYRQRPARCLTADEFRHAADSAHR